MGREAKIFAKEKDRLKSSLKIKQYIDTNFPGGRLNIRNGVKADAQPKVENYPIIAFSNIEEVASDSDAEETFLQLCGVAIFDETDETEDFVVGTPTTPETETKELPGRKKIEEFRELVKNEVLNVKGLYAKKKVTGETMTSSVFPVFKSTLTFTFSFKQEKRSGDK